MLITITKKELEESLKLFLASTWADVQSVEVQGIECDDEGLDLLCLEVNMTEGK